eukprot:CAMPEP_0176183982 /NCGR_PEP_ID=MMETSP0121_2-20121125/571_1 /TAXON_ID=160619 /ORGANISM="Kryptoperidinium foliaceum, Strain CCMP 1326" /LENGTH=172 /DNA_ID=CAMNT_0017522325 /DNA_START=25 /DNA_END=541 /DNA_ORIENTATION=+
MKQAQPVKVHRPGEFHRADTPLSWAGELRVVDSNNTEANKLLLLVEQVKGLAGFLAPVLPHPSLPCRIERVWRSEVCRRDFYVFEETQRHGQALFCGGGDASDQPFVYHRPEHYQVELHLEVRLPARQLPISRVHDRVLEAHEVVEGDAKPRVRQHAVHVLAPDLPPQLLPV